MIKLIKILFSDKYRIDDTAGNLLPNVKQLLTNNMINIFFTKDCLTIFT